MATPTPALTPLMSRVLEVMESKPEHRWNGVELEVALGQTGEAVDRKGIGRSMSGLASRGMVHKTQQPRLGGGQEPVYVLIPAERRISRSAVQVAPKPTPAPQQRPPATDPADLQAAVSRVSGIERITLAATVLQLVDAINECQMVDRRLLAAVVSCTGGIAVAQRVIEEVR